jgi:hypothetical protein
MVWDVHAAKVSTAVSAVHDMAVGKDVGEGAFLAKLAVSLGMELANPSPSLVNISHLGKVLAGRSLCQWLI